MKFQKLINLFKKYIQFMPFYLFGSGCAFLVDLIVFTFLRIKLGPNISAFISFLFGTFTLFVVLSAILEYRLRTKRLGFFLQLIIGIGTLLINIMILNLIDYISQLINYDLYINKLDKSYYYAIFSKITSSCIGFVWTSSMSGKFLYKKK